MKKKQNVYIALEYKSHQRPLVAVRVKITLLKYKWQIQPKDYGTFFEQTFGSLSDTMGHLMTIQPGRTCWQNMHSTVYFL